MVIADHQILLQGLQFGDATVIGEDGGRGAAFLSAGVLDRGFLQGNDVVEDEEEVDEKDDHEDGVENEEDDLHDTAHEHGDAEDLSEEQEENGIEKINGGGDDGEDVGRLAHVGSNRGGSDKEAGLDDQKDNGLSQRAGLAKRDRGPLDQRVEEERNHEPKRTRPVVDVQEAPAGEADGVGVERVRGILSKGSGESSALKDLEHGPTQHRSHGEPHADCQNNLGGGIPVNELPQTETAQLGIS